MRTAEVTVAGFDKLDRQLAALEQGVPPREIASALMAGALVIGDEERRLVPRLSGNLHDSIIETMWASNLPSDGLTVYIGPRTGKGGPDGWYGFLVEYGRSGVPAHPFARVAFDNKAAAAAGLVVTRLSAQVVKLAA